jgi:hypothetical protein
MGKVDEHLSPPPGLPPAAAKDAHPIRVNPCPIFISFPIRALRSHDDTTQDAMYSFAGYSRFVRSCPHPPQHPCLSQKFAPKFFLKTSTSS